MNCKTSQLLSFSASDCVAVLTHRWCVCVSVCACVRAYLLMHHLSAIRVCEYSLPLQHAVFLPLHCRMQITLTHRNAGVSRAAHRGANCIRFGPDVTKRFLGNNSLSLCIRSHEVPNSLRGFEDKHDGRLITVFTASNYCGQTGNYGAGL